MSYITLQSLRKMQKEEDLAIPDVMPEPYPNNRPGKNPLLIKSQDFWFKIFGMLNQLWVLIEDAADSERVVVYWINDISAIVKSQEFANREEAKQFIQKDGYRLFGLSRDVWSILCPPGNPYSRGL